MRGLILGGVGLALLVAGVAGAQPQPLADPEAAVVEDLVVVARDRGPAVK
jgi:hypothetical protein